MKLVHRFAPLCFALAVAGTAPAFAFDVGAAVIRLQELGIKVSNQPVSAQNVAKLAHFSPGNASEKLTDADMVLLGALPALDSVEIFKADNVTLEGIKALTASKTIKSLQLSGVKVGDLGAKAIGGMAQLERLSLRNAREVTSAAAPSVAGLKRLRVLDISGLPFDDAALAHFAGHPALENVSLASMKQITDAGVAHLGSAPKLRTLQLTFTLVTGRFVDAFAQSKSLNEINAMDTKLNDADLSGIAKLTSLKNLFIWHNAGIGDATIAQIAKLPNLEIVYLNKTGITDKGLEAIGKMPSLRWIWVSDTAVTDAGVATLQLPKLESFRADSTRVTDATVERLAVIPTLTNASFSRSAVTKEGVARALATRPANLPKLTIHN